MKKVILSISVIVLLFTTIKVNAQYTPDTKTKPPKITLVEVITKDYDRSTGRISTTKHIGSFNCDGSPCGSNLKDLGTYLQIDKQAYSHFVSYRAVKITGTITMCSSFEQKKNKKKESKYQRKNIFSLIQSTH